MKTKLIIAAMLAAAGLAGAQMFAQLFGGAEWTPAALGPIAWYKGENNALDSAGANNGTWTGTAAYSTGKVGNAFSLSGASAVGVTTNYSFAGASSFSYAAWVAFSNPAGSEEFVFAHLGYDINKRSYKITRHPSGVLTLTTYSSGGLTPTAFLSGGVLASTPTHVCISVSGIVATLYTNGVVAASGNVTARYDTGGSVVSKIGAAGSSLAVNSGYMSGIVDDVLIFSRALTQSEVQKLYTESVLKNGSAW